MSVLYVTTPGARVSLAGERLEIELPPSEDRPDGERRGIALRDVEQAVLGRSIHMTMPALTECLRRSIPVVFMCGGERVAGVCVPAPPSAGGRLAQFRAALDPTAKRDIARSLVRAKIHNSRRVLQRLALNREADAAAALARLETLADDAGRAETADALRGAEGAAAAIYFGSYGEFYPAHCPFERRSRRPPHNAPNEILSYAYTLLVAELEADIWAAGLDPAVGFYHETRDRRPSLALDLLEPFRAPIADALALDLISHRALLPDQHFESREGGVFLNREGRKKFFAAFERRMTREFFGNQAGRRTTLRDELRRQAVALRQHLVSGDPFEPFLMN